MAGEEKTPAPALELAVQVNQYLSGEMMRLHRVLEIGHAMHEKNITPERQMELFRKLQEAMHGNPR